MTDSHNRFLGNRALSPETLMMGYGYESSRVTSPPICPSSTRWEQSGGSGSRKAISPETRTLCWSKGESNRWSP
jgi:hypothetical protein